MNVTNNLQENAQHQQHQVNHNTTNATRSSENDEEPVVTSTSNDLSLSSPAHVHQHQHQHQQIDTTITSPARITSSTGNDYSISPPLRQEHHQLQQQQHHQQQVQQQNNTTQTQQQRQFKIDLTVDGSSGEDDSRSQQEFVSLIQEQQQQQQQEQQYIDTIDVSDVVMPTTSSTNNFKTNSSASSIKSKKLAALSSSASTSKAFATDMVARDLLASASAVADSVGGGSSSGTSSSYSIQHNAVLGNSTRSDNTSNSVGGGETHKIILKLPRNAAAAASATATTESQMDVDPTTSNSSSNSSNNSSFVEDTRKVEPLKINLHSHTQNVVPKITIKPIIKKPTGDLIDDFADDVSVRTNTPIPKLTIKSSTATSMTTATSTESNSSSCLAINSIHHEPHIVPKLTIRSGSEDGGSAHSSIVPKLTIKMSDSSQSHSSGNLLPPIIVVPSNTTNTTKSPSVSSAAQPLEQQVPPPPLPKLTIKTSLDGTSESIISTISPASLSSSSTSSSSSSSSSNASLQSPAAAASTTIPKLTIKTITKPAEELVPKLTIKTNAAGTISAITGGEAISECTTEDAAASGSSKIPKLTIKTGQEHAVIITQHHNDVTNSQSIPKLTIKTKSLDVADTASTSQDLLSDSNRDEPPPEKIPKITIKANDTPHTAETPKFIIKTQTSETTENPPAIPKLTISVSNIDCSTSSASGPQSPLVVRQLTAISRKPESPERVPKLMISRQDTSTSSNSILVISNHVDASEKTVPKLTIKTSNLDATESKEKATKFSIKSSSNSIHDEETKIPKLTIKPLLVTSVAAAQQSQSSEESDECVSLSSCSSPVTVPPDEQNTTTNKLVPKLTIKNLCSPKPIVKTSSSTTDTASKKSIKNDAVAVATVCAVDDVETAKNDTVDTPPNENIEKLPVVAAVAMNAEETIDEGFATMTTVNETVTTNGESSSSQEFCGFNDNTTDSTTTNIIEERMMLVAAADCCGEEEPRRHSDDMDIDDALQEQHDPQVFNNVAHFASSNGESLRAAAEVAEYMLVEPPNVSPQLSHVIDTVDLTSSPSPGSSPTHFNYADSEQLEIETQPNLVVAKTSELLEHLQQQRETSVIQKTSSSLAKTNSILLNQLTSNFLDVPATEHDALLQPIAPPPLQPKPICIASSNSTKYPQLTERLLANGIHSSPIAPIYPSAIIPPIMKTTMPQKVIDSIEILDTPEGSPRSSLDEEHAPQFTVENHILQNNLIDGDKESSTTTVQNSNNKEILHRNNNNLLRVNHINLKRHAQVTTPTSIEGVSSVLEQDSLQIIPKKVRRIENESNTMATITILSNDHQDSTTTVITTSPTILQSNNHCAESKKEEIQHPPAPPPPQHRSRKQKHEHLLSMPIEEEDPLTFNCIEGRSLEGSQRGATPTTHFEGVTEPAAAADSITPINIRKRGRPRKVLKNSTTTTPQAEPIKADQLSEQTLADDQHEIVGFEDEDKDKAVKSRISRVQMLRKRLAIDMVATELPPPIMEEDVIEQDDISVRLDSTPRRERNLRTPLRTSRRSATPNMLQMESKQQQPKRNNEATVASSVVSPPLDSRKIQNNKSKKSSSQMINDTAASINHHQHFGGSNSSISSACSSSSISSTTTSAAAIAMAAQIDLTMSSSSSSSGCSNTITTVEAGGSHQQHKHANSMLPPTTILSSSDPLADVVFKPNDFSSLVAAEQLRSPNSKSRHGSLEDVNIMLTPTALSRKGSRTDSQDDTGGSGADNSGEDSASSSSATTPGRGRGRGRGRSRGSGGGTRGPRAHRLGRGASAVAKAIAMSRPRCVGGLKHTPDPQRLKSLFSPAPQVFEEDTRMSADLSQQELTQSTSISRQLDFLTNEESQSSIISNTSILDPNTVAAVQNGAQSAQKRQKKKKMEVCVVDEAELTVASIAEYDWPPPKGCCPSKNRDTFMIQEQVALYLGIKSFKRKYPDLPRRQIDMEERNWLQEKQLVSEKMCDLGITAVWATDILDIMYTDFYEKYEEYKDFIRQKHLREIEIKQKALGLNVTGRGMLARDRAMLSTSKWNAYFNRIRKEERNSCLDLQTLTLNVPVPGNAAVSTLINRPLVDSSVLAAVTSENLVALPAALQKPNLDADPLNIDKSYPLALVPGQYCEKYRHYSALELRSYPINTVLDHPFAVQKPRIAMDSETDTESAAETTNADMILQTNVQSVFGKRVPIRRSRRARTHATNVAAAERAKINCDIRDEKEKLESKNANSSSDDNSSTSSSSSSGSETSSSETDSDDSSYSSVDDESPAKCGVCHRTQNKNLKDLPELFIKCYTCRRKVHPSCIEMPHRMVARVRNYNWQCAECKCCIKCKRKDDQNKMLFCEQCDRGFHIYCMGVKAVPDGRWSCERCSVCMRCGATKPEGFPQNQNIVISPSYPGGQPQIKHIKHKKVKWINEYRIDHITKLREHCSMLCVPCGRAKTTINKRNNNNHHGNSGAAGITNTLLSPPIVHGQMSPPPAPGASTTNA